MLYLAKTESTHSNECGSHFNELAQAKKPQLLMLAAAASLSVAAVRFLFRCSEYISHRSERSLHCEVIMCNVIVEILCEYKNVCLLRITSFDNLMVDVHVGTLTQAYTCDITNESLNRDMAPRYWVIYEQN